MSRSVIRPVCRGITRPVIRGIFDGPFGGGDQGPFQDWVWDNPLYKKDSFQTFFRDGSIFTTQQWRGKADANLREIVRDEDNPTFADADWSDSFNNYTGPSTESLGYLNEFTVANQVVWSEDLTQAAWAKNEVTIEDNSTNLPDGTPGAYDIVPSTNNTTHNVVIDAGNNSAANVGTRASISYKGFFKVKAGSAEQYRIRITLRNKAAPANFARATFPTFADLAGATNDIVYRSGALTFGGVWTQNAGNDRIYMLQGADGYWSFEFTCAPNQEVDLELLVELLDGAASTFVGDGTSGITHGGSCVFLKDWPSSYVPTRSGIAITRAKTNLQSTSANLKLPDNIVNDFNFVIKLRFPFRHNTIDSYSPFGTFCFSWYNTPGDAKDRIYILYNTATFTLFCVSQSGAVATDTAPALADFFPYDSITFLIGHGTTQGFRSRALTPYVDTGWTVPKPSTSLLRPVEEIYFGDLTGNLNQECMFHHFGIHLGDLTNAEIEALCPAPLQAPARASAV